MRATAACLYKGFWGRSLDEFKRLANIAFKLEGIKGPSGPMPLHNFHTAESLKEAKVMSDADIGGFSKATLDWIPPPGSASASAPGAARDAGGPGSGTGQGYAHFHGTISTALPPDRPQIQRSGFAAWRTLDRPRTLFGRGTWDIDMYTYLALRVRSDGRSWLVNVQTESLEPTDLHQHRLYVRRPGAWETVLIRWNDFVRTNHGFVVEPQAEMLRQSVRSVGLGLTDRVPGPFDLAVDRIWATNDASEADADPPDADPLGRPPREGQLRDKQGRNIAWSDK
ncbi:CIA30-domain-containing protein [Durotheca rogersii]|uniref:CIA30-domain-containing protein n=1 Tax=Durotheca rogersii TaxID=419775 RepID=UPI00221EBB69|nr:CIA30-domain-containing protein [Durotheca rogersii]KAI5860732.1 CIA30-domain-containing protein [Durotheca rogersii]